MEKVTRFFNGDPDETEFFGLGRTEKVKGPRVVTKEQEKKWIAKRNEARKNPPSFALVQDPKVYD